MDAAARILNSLLLSWKTLSGPESYTLMATLVSQLRLTLLPKPTQCILTSILPFVKLFR